MAARGPGFYANPGQGAPAHASATLHQLVHVLPGGAAPQFALLVSHAPEKNALEEARGLFRRTDVLTNRHGIFVAAHAPFVEGEPRDSGVYVIRQNREFVSLPLLANMYAAHMHIKLVLVASYELVGPDDHRGLLRLVVSTENVGDRTALCRNHELGRI